MLTSHLLAPSPTQVSFRQPVGSSSFHYHHHYHHQQHRPAHTIRCKNKQLDSNPCPSLPCTCAQVECGRWVDVQGKPMLNRKSSGLSAMRCLFWSREQ
ncbi:hypothetical protein CGRA01v4_15026 [Colletotrichum graminicola]|nr:hypothetical protein CGRA01v4_15026 [Colletotrichum graminicola]